MTAAEQRPQVDIREMTEEDIEGVLAIDRKITGSNRAMTYATLPSSYVGGALDVSVVAEAGGQIVGFWFGRITDSPRGRADTALLELIGVDLGYQHQGIGTRLAQAFMEQCRRKRVRSVRTIVSWHDWWLLSFVRSLGFIRGEMAEFVKPIER